MQEILKQAEQLNTKQKVKTTVVEKTDAEVSKKFSEIKGNTFYKIVFDPKGTADEKKNAVAKALTFDKAETKEQNLARLKEYELFKDFLQTERKKMAQQIIELTDTGTFSQLKNVFDKLNTAIIQFDENLKPLTDILDAVYQLRMAGKGEDGSDITIGVFKEIKDELAAEEARQKALKEKAEKLQNIQNTVTQNENDVATLSEQKSLFGFGKIKKSAREEIALKQLETQRAQAEAAALAAELEQLNTPPSTESKYANFKEQKAQLMKLLNISDEGHVENNKKLVESAQKFVNDTSKEVDGVRNHLGEMETQTRRLGDGNTKLQTIYALLTDAVKDAAKANKETSETLKVAEAEESTLAKMKREEKLNTANGFIKSMDFAMVDTLETYGGLAEESVRINAMSDMCQQQIADVNKLATSGVAGVASSLATVVTGVAQTALNESSEMAKGSIAAMHDRTLALTAQGSISAAMGVGQLAEEFNKAVAGMDQMYQGLKTATKIRATGLENLKTSKAAMEEAAKALQEAVKEATEVHAEVDIQGSSPTVRKAAANDDGKAAKPAAQPAALEGFTL